MSPLPDPSLELKSLCPAWEIREGSLCRSYRFRDFAAALRQVQAISLLAEAMNHHPELNFGWGFLHLSLKTHDLNALSVKDFELARRIDAHDSSAPA